MTAQENPTSPPEGHYAVGLRDGGSEWHVGPVGTCCGKRMLPTDPPLPESALHFDVAGWHKAVVTSHRNGKRPRRKPYTERGIRRVPCHRCGRPSSQQWDICADNNVPRGLCIECDIDLNRMVLEWVGDPDIDAKMAAYRDRLEGPAA